MKLIVNTFPALFLALSLTAQTYSPDQFIVEYQATATATDQQAVRDLYGITDYIPLVEDVELWSNLPFPITVTENGSTSVIHTVEELMNYIIEVQENDNEGSNTTASINNGTPNYTAELIDDGTLNEDGTFDPLPYCDDIHNNRLIGIDQSNSPHHNRLKVVIIDQAVSGINNVTVPTSPAELGGSHGNKVFSIINNILTQAGITEVEYTSLVLFDNQGNSSLAALAQAMQYIINQFEQGIWNTHSDRVLINLSANVVLPVESNEMAGFLGNLIRNWTICLGIKSDLGDYPVLMINSAGNNGLVSDNIFPACLNFTSEISVAGTESCFSQPWENTNQNPVGYEIAAEAKSVLTEDNGLYYLSNGTSYSSAFVTAIAAQIAVNRITHSIDQIRTDVLNAVDYVPALESTVADGRVVNIQKHIWHQEGGSGGFFLQSSHESTALHLQITPNPFTHAALVNISVEAGQSPRLSLYNSIGQLVHQEVIYNQQEMTELQWYTPEQLARGTYLLRVQVGDLVEQQMIVKQ